MTLEFILRAWPVFAALIGVVAWFIRLESKVLYLERDHLKQNESNEKRESTMWAKIDAIQATSTAILQSLAKIEGKLEAREKSERTLTGGKEL